MFIFVSTYTTKVCIDLGYIYILLRDAFRSSILVHPQTPALSQDAAKWSYETRDLKVRIITSK